MISLIAMPALVPGIYGDSKAVLKFVDGRDEPGHVTQDTPQAGRFRSGNWHKVHEPVHVLTIGKKPDDNAGIVDPIDESTHHAECCCLRRAGGIVIVPISPVEDKTMHSVIVGGEKSHDRSVIIAAER